MDKRIMTKEEAIKNYYERLEDAVARRAVTTDETDLAMIEIEIDHITEYILRLESM